MTVSTMLTTGKTTEGKMTTVAAGLHAATATTIGTFVGVVANWLLASGLHMQVPDKVEEAVTGLCVALTAVILRGLAA